MSKNIISKVDLLLSVMDKKTWQTASQVGQKIDEIALNVIPLLLLGQDTIFTNYLNTWKIKKRATDEMIAQYRNAVIEGRTAPESVWAAYAKAEARRESKKKADQSNGSKRLRGGRPISYGEGVDYSRESLSTLEIRRHGFAYGKKKSYKGPEGQYWTDPNFVKKEL